MSNELVPYEGKQPVVMKGGLVHWVSIDTADRIQQQLQTQASHTFVKIRELNITINTAEVEGVYTMEQYADIEKVKQGMWQCKYKGWHNKGKVECQCAKDFFRRQAETRKEREQAESNRPQTPEEQANSRARMRLMNEEAALIGKRDSIWRQMYTKGNSAGRTIRRSTIDAWVAKNGPTSLEGLDIDEDVERERREEAVSVLD